MNKELFLMLLLIFLGACSSKEQSGQQEGSHQNHGQIKADESLHDSSLHNDNPDNKVRNIDSATALPTDVAVISNQGFILPKDIEFTYSMQADGYILPDVRRNRGIAARFGGRVEKSFVKSNYQYVRAGQVLFEVYSPEVNSLIEEYLFLKRSNAGETLLQGQKEKLRLLGLSESYLENVVKTNKLHPVIIYSPSSGYVLWRETPSATGTPAEQAGTASPGGGMNSMGGTGSPQSSTSTGSNGRVKEGEYFSKGQTLLQINDLKSVWALTSFTMSHGNFLKKGMPVVISPRLDSGYKTHSRIDFIEPFHQSGQKFFQVRSYVPNSQTKYRPYTQVRAGIVHSVSGLSLPRSAVYDTGRKQVVWVKKGQTGNSGVYYAREVISAPASNDSVAVISGLTVKDTVARDAAYLVDREGLIKIEKR